MGKADYLSLGDWNALCDVCGFKFKASMLKFRWDNLYTCPRCWEERHPQDFIRGVQDIQTPPWVRPDPGADNQNWNYVPGCTPTSISAISGNLASGCVICGRIWPGYPIQSSP